MNRLASLLALCVGVLFAACPAPGPCEKRSSGDLSSKYGTCVNVTSTPLLGSDTATCTMKLSRCSAEERELASKALDCLSKLAKCDVATQAEWVAQRDGCYGPLGSVSPSCVESLAIDYPTPDAGQPDAGPPSIEDGGAGIELVVVGDEQRFAIAWTPLQAPTNVVEWQLLSSTDAGTFAPVSIRPNTVVDLMVGDAGLRSADGGWESVKRSFYVVGFGADGVALGTRSDGGGVVDAGASNCQQNRDCMIDEVCSLGLCRREICVPGGPNTCPATYVCIATANCVREIGDAGSFDAGMSRPDAGAPDRIFPMISSSVSASVGPVGNSETVPVGSYAASRPDMVAIDSARVVIATAQEGNVVAHSSHRRGRDFVTNEGETTSVIDTRGADVHLAYNAESRVLFACYTAGVGVRVRASRDLGLTWLPGAADVESMIGEDGGIGELVHDCDIAAWQGGGALMATVEGNKLVTRTISPQLVQALAGIAFTGNDEIDAGVAELGTPSHPAIATLPADGVVHVVFTANRVVNASGLRDPEVYGLFRDPTRGYGQPLPLGTPNPFLQDYATVVLDPVTKRPLAAYTSREERNSIQFTTVYVSAFNRTQMRWSTGPDLSVLYTTPMMNTHPIVPFKRTEDPWDVFSPSLAASPSGRIFLGFIGGPRALSGVGNDYRAYAVEYDFAAANPAITTPGWFLVPAFKLSDVRARDPRAGTGPVTPVGVVATDKQLSLYSTFLEGAGPNGDQSGRAMYMSRP